MTLPPTIVCSRDTMRQRLAWWCSSAPRGEYSEYVIWLQKRYLVLDLPCTIQTTRHGLRAVL